MGYRGFNITSSGDEVNIQLEDELESLMLIPKINSDLNFLSNYLKSDLKAFAPFKDA
jgi:hypothetical protein